MTAYNMLISDWSSDVCSSDLGPWIPAYEKLGHVPTRTGSRLPESTPNNLYPTADEQFIHITAMGNTVFCRLALAMGQPELADDPRFSSATERSHHHKEIDDLIAQWTDRKSTHLNSSH